MPTTSPLIAEEASLNSRRETTSARLEGRIFGLLVLSAFVLYGVGSALADDLVGLALIAVNSAAVAVIGMIGFRLIREDRPRVAMGYLAGRIAEAVLLLGGVVLATRSDTSTADNTGYLLGMFALGLGSIPFWHSLGRDGLLPTWLAGWGIVGYAALALGALIELATGSSVLIVFAIVGGLFELFIGIRLLMKGFARSA